MAAGQERRTRVSPGLRDPIDDGHILCDGYGLVDGRGFAAEEEQFCRNRASRAVSAASRGSMGMTGTLALGIVISYAAMIGLSLLASSLLTH